MTAGTESEKDFQSFCGNSKKYFLHTNVTGIG